MTRITILSVLVSAALLFYILEMVRRRRLREEYSILWLAGGVILLVFSLKNDWLEWASDTAGIYYPPSFLFLIGMLFILLILIHFSITISKLYHMNKKMAQEIAHLKQARGEELGEEANPIAPSPQTPETKDS
ncbi:MAG: DUF2304 domain-containing protein [Deltaproteobacteria bacterium]|nr:DUF2304 domain-containing protein [Deltaproteobacteria bacterium]NNG46940.1 DUF2304 domain-containing protein [Deltaproteobacteria bacterium]